MRFKGDDKEINIKTKKPEFMDWKWVEIEDLTNVVVHFKLNVYKKVKTEVKKYILST